MSRLDAAEARVAAARRSDGTAPAVGDLDRVADLVPTTSGDPRASVLVACHDDGAFLLDALASLRLCDHEEIEVIVADDHSITAETRDVLDRIGACGITVLASPGRGPSPARNAALAVARAPYVVPLDADNLLRPGFLPAAVAALDADVSLAVVHADAERFGASSGRWDMPSPPVADLLTGNQLDTCAVLRRSVVLEVEGWDPELVGSEDWGLWVALLEVGARFTTLDQVGWDYRVRPASLTHGRRRAAVLSDLCHLVETHPAIYAAHLPAVVRNLAAALLDHDLATGPGVPDDEPTGGGRGTPEERRLRDRIAALEADLAARERFGDVARRRAALVEERADDLAARVVEAEQRTSEVERRAIDAEEHLVLLQQTKLFRWARAPRDRYAELRRRARRGRTA